MEYQKAIDILQNLAKKPELTAEEKEALSSAIGMLTIWGIRDEQSQRQESQAG